MNVEINDGNVGEFDCYAYLICVRNIFISKTLLLLEDRK